MALTDRRGLIERPPLLFVLRALGLGDFLTAVPAFRALRRAFPTHEMVLATRPSVAALAPLACDIDAVVRGGGPYDFAAPTRRPDVAVNLHGHGPQSTERLTALGPSRLLSFGLPGVSASGDRRRWDDAEHEVDRWCRLLEECGIPADPADLLLPQPAVLPPVADAVVVHPGAAYASRRWPAERFAAVAGALARDGYLVIVTGTAPERSLAAHVAETAGLPATAVLAGTTDVLHVAALVACARLVVSGDTGIAHLATAFGTPSVTVFGPVTPRRWGPPDDPRHLRIWHGGRDYAGNPWAEHPDPVLLRATVHEVLAATRRLLAPQRRRETLTAR